MKKEIVLTLLVVILLSTQFVAAQNQFTDNLVGLIENTLDAISEIFGPLFGEDGGVFGEFLFIKILLFFVLFSIIFISLKRIDLFGENRTVHVIVTTVASLFSIRYIGGFEIIKAIILPYTVLGAAISMFLPLLIYFYFLHYSTMGAFGRRFGWFLYGAIFVVFWSYNYEKYKGSNWIFFLVFGFVILSFLFDKHLHHYLEMGKYNEPRKLGIEQRIADLGKSVSDAKEIWT